MPHGLAFLDFIGSIIKSLVYQLGKLFFFNFIGIPDPVCLDKDKEDHGDPHKYGDDLNAADIEVDLELHTSESHKVWSAKLSGSVIVTRSGGPEEIVTHGENGWMIDLGNPAAMAEAVEKLATDRDLSEMLATKGQAHAARTFDIDTMLNAYQQVYDNLLL